MRTIAFVTQKGGSGKSTLAISIAVAAMQDGEKVYILETDRQGTISNWGVRRSNPLPDIDQVANAAALEQALTLLRSKGFTLAIIDTPGTDSVTNTAAIRIADLCIIPTRPSPADIEAAHPTLAAIRKTGKQFAFVLNQTPARSFRLNEASAALNMMGALALPYVALRNDHQDALGAGLGVTEYAPDGKAAEEIGALWGWIKRKLKGVADDPAAFAAQ
ncbi:MAG: ParA family protein [Roseiarcus sp.]